MEILMMNENLAMLVVITLLMECLLVIFHKAQS